jgi:hypothetical protein
MREETLCKIFYDDNITFIPKLYNHIERKENYRLKFFMELVAKILN